MVGAKSREFHRSPDGVSIVCSWSQGPSLWEEVTIVWGGWPGNVKEQGGGAEAAVEVNVSHRGGEQRWVGGGRHDHRWGGGMGHGR